MGFIADDVKRHLKKTLEEIEEVCTTNEILGAISLVLVKNPDAHTSSDSVVFMGAVSESLLEIGPLLDYLNNLHEEQEKDLSGMDEEIFS